MLTNENEHRSYLTALDSSADRCDQDFHVRSRRSPINVMAQVEGVPRRRVVLPESRDF